MATTPATRVKSSDLLALEGLMTEFFSGMTSNARKAEIEVMLNNFEAQNDSWRDCLNFMAATDNQYVLMFALNTLQVSTPRSPSPN